MVEFDKVETFECGAVVENFWKSLERYLNKPNHINNRRVFASCQLRLYKLVNTDATDIYDWLDNLKSTFVDAEKFEESITNSLKLLNERNISVESLASNLEDIDISKNEKNDLYIRFAKLIPRRPTEFVEALQITLIDVKCNSVTFLHHKNCNNDGKRDMGMDFIYQIKYDDHNVSMLMENFEQYKDDKNVKWLKDHILPKLIKWMVNNEPNNRLIDCSLKLVSNEKYNILYNKLKVKYGNEMLKIWPENTDPKKFVYEDIAIATYLISLWRSERVRLKLEKMQTFLDLGCGNGLLVHILNNEGYSGSGIDLRERKIWKLYPESTKLEVKTIIPSSKSLFPEVDWLIGNHSDELTPWTPVIAARSSYNCRFFLLPCCAYEFDGKKYQRSNSDSSQYFDYMQYIQDVGEKCGFITVMDRLKIPSTKRVCLVGMERNYPESESNAQDLKIQELINSRCNGIAMNDIWASTFKPRDTTEEVRNCTQIDKSSISSIVGKIVSILLSKVRQINPNPKSDKTWNAGGLIGLNEAAAAIDPETLKELKNEFGGLQTLLRNNGDIFTVEYGKVRFRVPGLDKAGRKKKSSNSTSIVRKIKKCWFYKNHPDGCPLSDNECDFIH